MSTPQRHDYDREAEQMKERLEQLDADIKQVRLEEEELEHKHEGHRFYESGEDPSQDDQNASPA